MVWGSIVRLFYDFPMRRLISALTHNTGMHTKVQFSIVIKVTLNYNYLHPYLLPVYR